jgi:cell division inhibitor SulA
MYKFLIERELPGAGQLTNDQLVAVAQKSCGVLRDLGPQIQWVHSYVTADKITCIYLAPDAELIREHARRGGFPADRIEQIDAIIDPVTAQGALWDSASAAPVA